MNRFPTTTLLRQHRLAAAVLVALLPAAAMAAPTVAFNPSLLHGNIDVSRFERDGNLPGIYNVDVQVNGRSVGKQEVEVRETDGEERLCLQAPLFDLLGLDIKKLEAMRDKGEQADLLPLPTASTCEDLGRFIPSAQASLNADEQILEISMPQAFLASRSSGWVDPSQWDNGINAFLLNYSVNHTRSQFGGESASRTSGSLDAGLNLGAWRFRHSGYFSQVNGDAPMYSAGTSYAQREIRRWNAQLTLGEASTDGDLFNSVGYLGANLRTDPRMLPETANNYAPVVRGVAQTNARVTIRQAGHVVFETTVAPGPFEIDDLRNTSRGGDLEVEVTEADGRVESFVVPYAAVPGLLRQGQQRSSVTVGQLRNEQTDAPMFAQATVRR
ncbi:fimbrial biogenesis outer membrane usher protein, partial [Stenotrophomonas maltophilia]